MEGEHDSIGEIWGWGPPPGLILVCRDTAVPWLRVPSDPGYNPQTRPAPHLPAQDHSLAGAAALLWHGPAQAPLVGGGVVNLSGGCMQECMASREPEGGGSQLVRLRSPAGGIAAEAAAAQQGGEAGAPCRGDPPAPQQSSPSALYKLCTCRLVWKPLQQPQPPYPRAFQQRPHL